MTGAEAERFYAGPRSRLFTVRREAAHFTAKAEPHNHPTAISPFAGAATGSGEEIRDTANGKWRRPSMPPVSTAHGEGRGPPPTSRTWRAQQTRLRFADYRSRACESYPANPNGLPGGGTGFTGEDGRFTIMMPHPERVFRATCNPWRPSGVTLSQPPQGLPLCHHGELPQT